MQAQPSLHDNGAVVLIDWGDATYRFHAFWLHDNVQAATTGGQKRTRLNELPADVRIVALAADTSGLQLGFSHPPRQARFTWDWLRTHAYDRPRPDTNGWTDTALSLWTQATAPRHPPTPFARLAYAPDLRAWLAQVARYGFARLTAGPLQSGTLFEVVDHFGHVRETHYGRHFEVRVTPDPTNLAYTSLGLQAHTDNPYRSAVPTLQLLYCLENSATGGENQLVDGFAAARRLQREHPRSFELLSRYCARFEYREAGRACLRARRPLIELGPDGELQAIRFNNRSIAPIVDVPFDDLPDYYAACRDFGCIIDDPQMQIEFRLQPGDGFLVDNTRTLHARSAYDPGSGSRWLQGCYADKDELLSTLTLLTEALRPWTP